MFSIVLEYDEEVETVSDNAKLFLIEGEEVWIPENLIEHQDLDDQTIEIPRWKAKDLRLIED